jgi:hypothetical protein
VNVAGECGRLHAATFARQHGAVQPAPAGGGARPTKRVCDEVIFFPLIDAVGSVRPGAFYPRRLTFPPVTFNECRPYLLKIAIELRWRIYRIVSILQHGRRKPSAVLKRA